MTAHLANTPVLETERLTLRAPAPQDADALRAFMASDRSHFVGGPKNAHDAWRSHAMLIGHWALRGFGMFSICRKGTDAMIGMTGPFMPEGWPELEIGWSLVDPEAEGHGFASEAAAAARQYAYDDLGRTAAVSYINPANARSIAVAENLGCTLDESAVLPDLPGWDDVAVYRHPALEAAA